MTNHFLRDLDATKKLLLHMGGLVEAATNKAIHALVNRRMDLIDQVIGEDAIIDAYENDIDDACLKMLALQAPVAQDLRFVLTVMRVNNELERMGDHAKGIALCARALCKEDPIPVYGGLESMSGKAMNMVKMALDSLVRADVGLAQKVREADEAVDEDYRNLFAAIQAVMHSDPRTIDRGVQAITACRNLERIADLATNIAKDVIFMVRGDQVRHGGATARNPHPH